MLRPRISWKQFKSVVRIQHMIPLISNLGYVSITYSISGQIVFNYRLSYSAVGFKLTANVSWRMRTVAVNIDFVNSALHVTQQSQLFASSLVKRFDFYRKKWILKSQVRCFGDQFAYTEMTILSRVASSSAIANNAAFVNITQSAVLTGVWSMARIYQLAIVKRYFADKCSRKQCARVKPFTVHNEVSYATDKTCQKGEVSSLMNCSQWRQGYAPG